MNSNDLNKSNFYFYAPKDDRPKLAALAQAYPDYEAVLQWMDAPISKWSLTLKKEFDYKTVDMDALDESFIPVGEQFGVDYDGYDRPVSKPGLATAPSAPKPKKTFFSFLKKR